MSEQPNAFEAWLLARLPRRAVVMFISVLLALCCLVLFVLVLAVLGLGIFALLFVAEMVKAGHGSAVLAIGGVILVGIWAIMGYGDIDKTIPHRKKDDSEPA